MKCKLRRGVEKRDEKEKNLVVILNLPYMYR